MKTSHFVLFVSLVVAFGGFVWGFDATVISGAVPFIKKYFDLNGADGDLKLGLAANCLGWGVLGGTAISGFLSDRFGRKKMLLGTALIFTASALLSATTSQFGLFVLSRVLGGIAVGGAILIVPVYIAEIAPANARGALVCLNQLMIVLGISAAFLSNWFLLDTGRNNWRWMLGIVAIPAALYFLLLFGVPESPRWLLGRGQEQKARGVLAKVRRAGQAEIELRAIRESFAQSAGKSGLGGLAGGKMRLVILIALAIAFFQQITGINAIFSCLPAVFAQAGGAQNAAFRQAVLLGLVSLGMTFAAIALIDRIGRKPLLILGASGMALSLLTCSWAFYSANYELTARSYVLLAENNVPPDFLAELKNSEGQVFATDAEFLAELERKLGVDRVAAYHDALTRAALRVPAAAVLLGIFGFVASFAISLGPVTWVLLPEIFPNELRGAAMSLSGFWSSAVSATVTLVFPWELSRFGGSGTFLGFGLFAIAALVFIVARVPETKGKSLEELETALVRAPLKPEMFPSPAIK